MLEHIYAPLFYYTNPWPLLSSSFWPNLRFFGRIADEFFFRWVRNEGDFKSRGNFLMVLASVSKKVIWGRGGPSQARIFSPRAIGVMGRAAAWGSKRPEFDSSFVQMTSFLLSCQGGRIKPNRIKVASSSNSYLWKARTRTPSIRDKD